MHKKICIHEPSRFSQSFANFSKNSCTFWCVYRSYTIFQLGHSINYIPSILIAQWLLLYIASVKRFCVSCYVLLCTKYVPEHEITVWHFAPSKHFLSWPIIIYSTYVQSFSKQILSCADMCLSTFQSLFHALNMDIIWYSWYFS